MTDPLMRYNFTPVDVESLTEEEIITFEPAPEGLWVKWTALIEYFTQEDVQFLRTVADDNGVSGWGYAATIADKIAALLQAE